jgi:flagellar protein FlgJ
MNQFDVVSTTLAHPGIGQTEMRLQYLASPNADTDPERLRGAARELEAYFLNVLITEMRKTIPTTPLLHGGKAEEIFQGFLDEELSQELARTGQLGLADYIYESLENLLKHPSADADI